MEQSDVPLPERLERFRPYLVALARAHLDRRLWVKGDPEEIVQDTFREAIEKDHQFRGGDDDRLRAWLRQILLHNILDKMRHFGRHKCDADRERALESSTHRAVLSLAAEQSSPSQQAARHELIDRLGRALARLPTDQRQAVTLHHLHELKLAEVADQLDRSVEAAAGLIHRGLENLRRFLEEE
jgi:RNA polymerase sigma-70 factor (ECF subfamily)